MTVHGRRVPRHIAVDALIVPAVPATIGIVGTRFPVIFAVAAIPSPAGVTGLPDTIVIAITI